MRTKTELEAKINDLEVWLFYNVNHPNRTIIESDLRNLKNQLDNKEYDEL